MNEQEPDNELFVDKQNYFTLLGFGFCVFFLFNER